MSRDLSAFLERFVLPMLSGGPVHVEAPIRPRDRDLMAEGGRDLLDPALGYARLRRAQLLVPDPMLPDPDLEELTLWVGLHNTLLFDHPERRRVWARSSTWRRVEGATRTFLTLPAADDIGRGLARHVSVGAFVELLRTDRVVATAAGDLRFIGQSVPRRRLRLSAVPQTGHREEVVQWLPMPHAPESERLIEDALRTSPLTCLLHPRRAPPGWSPLTASEFLRVPGYARAVAYAWAADPDWVAVGGAVAAALLPSLPMPRAPQEPRSDERDDDEDDDDDDEVSGDGPRGPEALGPARILALPGAVVPTTPEALSAVVGALVHLHFLKVVELEARVGALATGRDAGTLAFLAMPLLLSHVEEVIGTPLDAVDRPGPAPGPGVSASAAAGATSGGAVSRRWIEYVDHLTELVPRRTVENLLAALVPRIVQTA